MLKPDAHFVALQATARSAEYRKSKNPNKKNKHIKHTINLGPQRPAAHGVLRLVLEMNGEVVQGRLHRSALT